MKYAQRYTVKWHDTDANREVRPTQILMYMQETANAQLENAGLSLDRLRDERGLAFLLSRIAIRIYEPLYTRDEMVVETWVCEGKGLAYNRCFRILRGDMVVAEASSVWGLMDLKLQRLRRAEEAPYTLEPEPDLALDMPRRLIMPRPDEMERAGERRIVYSDIDYNGHMNNTRYPDLFCDFTPDIRTHRVCGMVLSFLHEAAFDHVLTVYRRSDEGGCFFRTVDESGAICTDAYVRLEPIKEDQA